MSIKNQSNTRQRLSRTQQEFNFSLHTSASIQLSRFQRIGCFILVVDGVKASDSQNNLFEEQYAIDYLTNIEGFDIPTAEILIGGSTRLKEIFELVWNHLDDYEKSVALWLNYEIYSNYWLYWDVYNQSLLPHIKLPSGSPEDIIGSPPQALPRAMMNTKRRTSVANPQNERRITAEDNGHPHVSAQYQYCEASCRDGHFSVPQQVYVILNALDDVHEDNVNQETARNLLLNRAHLSSELTESLIKEKKWPKRFSLLWKSLSDCLKSELIAEDWMWYESYWPGLECYNRTLCSIMYLPSGKPADIFAAAFNAPRILADQALQIIARIPAQGPQPPFLRRP